MYSVLCMCVCVRAHACGRADILTCQCGLSVLPDGIKDDSMFGSWPQCANRVSGRREWGGAKDSCVGLHEGGH